ncbi:solute carrier family 25 (mitochondrial phosphate transporter), member 23/24/25/41 [Cryptococcus deuterogattii 99/473]|uniref:Solute carrier family 25 (Mitochondrial phosphate transporter), member 23/24/25/41 n=2 Tax=Cryptococcus deuterogattii TaxID=1859096 RepID=A0A0D0UWS4_9TREE|nr:solute carrier family 25 (mitochondrial phosphate transporter) member 23/24/25/41 [Cryptococcus deuterogattii R265]KIR28099.1 solute carrier family 25 (mitochondrial phosphate transporter), member 23/24/25/41 [Cryptococcus deuterogattii LA55]KIR39726.1 solute carrier family 25 (mitochondrial phosphate transporter), member 23/24/25/41 [Cryptococcus deuterogattii Ram5]KIR70725.1 solute carrier family 25 (mitochondrial phosphate transporter), member 23/24/25/41 [Cryptococcus deuterogattii CA1014
MSLSTNSNSSQTPEHPTKLHRHSVQDEASEFAVATSSSTYAIAEEEIESESQETTFRGRLRDIMSDNQIVINTFIAGGLAGAASRTVVSPLERLKIILQVQATGSKSGAGQAYSGVWESLVRMWKDEGWRGFMKGNGINVVRILPYSALQFTSYGAFKSVLSTWSDQETLSTPLRLTAGAGAGVVAVVATYPLDLVRARLSIATANMAVRQSGAAFTNEDSRLGMVGMTKKVYKAEGGLRGLYRGCWATALGVAPYVSLNFFFYESVKTYVLPGPSSPPISETDLALRKLFCGAVSGASSLIFTHPFDVLRRKLQVAGLSTLTPHYDGAIDAMRQIIRNEGFWKGMYRGLAPNLIKVTPSIAVSFYVFELVRDSLEVL